MISVEEALKIVIDSAPKAKNETIKIQDCTGRILAESVLADRDFPPFDRVTMDGIAISYQEYKAGQRIFPIENICAAGSEKYNLKDPKNCVEIMTGAILPHGVDTVIRYEDLQKSDEGFEILIDLKEKSNVHKKGSDYTEGSILLNPGHKLKAIDCNILATVGKEIVQVYTLPRVAVISTGDELIPIEEVPLAHQLRQSNNHMLQSALLLQGIDSTLYHLKDSRNDIHENLQDILSKHSVIMLSGGVSKGKYDYIPEVLEELGIHAKFHRVAQRPGKPFWFGTKKDHTIFAFPGNPVSTLVCFYRYFLPWLDTNQCYISSKKMMVKLGEDVTFNPALTYFAQANISYNNQGECIAVVSHGNGSGDMVNPSKVDGFIVFPPDRKLFCQGEIFEFIPY